MTIAVWFSCGAASAVAAHLTVQLFGQANVRIFNNPVKEEDADNLRFKADIERLCGVPIECATNPRYEEGSAVQVWDDRKFMSSPKGAPCTTLLKKHARQHVESVVKIDWHVFGFTADEQKRHDKFVLSERENVLPVLIWAKKTKTDCVRYLEERGVTIPRVYRMGFPNANCIGCVKATSPTYWNLVRDQFPDVFAERAEQSRRLKCRLVRHNGKRLFLDELPSDAKGRPLKSMPECGIFCEEPS